MCCCRLERQSKGNRTSNPHPDARRSSRGAGDITHGRGHCPKSIEINFSADRNQLFSAWNAIANLADLAGKVTVTVHADSAEGFDRNKLQNGVLEPLRESDLIK